MAKTQTPVKQPTPPLPTGSGAHGLRGQVNALAGVLASKHALAECGPNASVYVSGEVVGVAARKTGETGSARLVDKRAAVGMPAACCT